MYAILLTLLLTTYFQAYSAKNVDIDSLLESVFGPKNTTKPVKTEVEGALLEMVFGPQATDTPPVVTHSSDNAKTNEPCTNLNGEKGVCVPYYNCEQDEVDIDSAIDLHYPDTSCNEYLDVCCRKIIDIHKVDSAV